MNDLSPIEDKDVPSVADSDAVDAFFAGSDSKADLDCDCDCIEEC